jgi:hypothetical protein
MKTILFVVSFVLCVFGSSKSITDYAVPNGKYLVVSKSISVLSGDTLIVPAGIYILFNNLCGINVSSGGTISAIGTKDKPVYFTSVHDTSDTASPFDWNGIDIEQGASAHFSYCFIAFSTSGITAAGSIGIQLENCIFNRNGQWNLSVSGIVTPVPDLQQFSYFPQSKNLDISSIPLIPKDTISTFIPVQKQKFYKSKIFIISSAALAVALTASGSYMLYKSHNYRTEYNAYLPGNPSFDSAVSSTRQLHFNHLRVRYNRYSAIGWSCIGLAVLDGIVLGITIKF